MEKEDI